MNRYDLVIFDLDGTLADTKQDLANATNQTMELMGLPKHAPDQVASFVGGGLTLLLQRALGPKLGADPEVVEKAAAIFKPWYREHMLDATRPYSGIEEMLAALRRSSVKMAVATNKPRMFTAGIVETLFPGLFDPIVACADDAPRKPDPTCVTLARTRNPGIPNDRILFVGDSVVDIETARNAGVHVLSCSWGYGERAALEERRPDWMVDQVSSITRITIEGKA